MPPRPPPLSQTDPARTRRLHRRRPGIGLPWLVVTVLVMAPSCTWVTPAEVGATIARIDGDGDGLPDVDDCAPDRADVGTAEEVPYDGLDNDCTDGDALDVDGEGFPGVDRATWEATRDAAGSDALWPPGLPGDRVDCDDGDARTFPGATERWYDGLRHDCDSLHDFDADRDGWIDAAAEADPDLATFARAWPDLHAAARPGDCDDGEPSVHPEAEDAPYDGVDADCGLDEDFDADGDGWVARAAPGVDDIWAAAQAYRARPGYEHLGAAPGDCLDQPRALPDATPVDPGPCATTPVSADGTVDPAAFHPGACEVFYDGVDGDCGNDDDFDADGDGIANAAWPTARDAYLAAWPDAAAQVDPDAVGDCADDRPDVFPGALEVLDDGLDSDCHPLAATVPGLADHAPAWQVAPWSVHHPDAPRLALQPGDGALEPARLTAALSLHTRAHTGGTPFSLSAPAYVLLALDGPPGAIPTPQPADGIPAWWRPGGATATLLDRPAPYVTGPPGEGDLFLLGGTAIPGSTATHLAHWIPQAPAPASPPWVQVPADTVQSNPAPADGDVALSDADLVVPPGGLTDRAPSARGWGVVCRPGRLTVHTVPPGTALDLRTTVVTPTHPACSGPDGCALGATCALAEDDGDTVVLTCHDGACTTLDVDASGTSPPVVSSRALDASFDDPLLGSLAGATALSTRTPTEGAAGPSLLVVRPDGRLDWSTPFDGPLTLRAGPTDLTVRDADGAWHDNALWALRITEDAAGTPGLALAELDPLRELVSVWDLPLPQVLAGEVPSGVSVAVGPERLHLAATTTDPATGDGHLLWSAVGWAP